MTFIGYAHIQKIGKQVDVVVAIGNERFQQS
jgi:hypothetical protein